MKPRFLASPNFALDYEVLDVGENGVQRVELWVTRDGGTHWQLYGGDGDQQSPMEVQVDREGLYGLRLVVHSAQTPNPQPPRSGDRPDMVIGIDWNKPFARIRRATYDSRQRRDITIEWQAEDALLEATPIRLSYSASPAGPWNAIAAHLPNSGVYRWRPQQSLPNVVYIQLEVSDMAGNVTSDVYASPVSFGEPRGLIRDIRPMDTNSTYRPRFQR